MVAHQLLYVEFEILSADPFQLKIKTFQISSGQGIEKQYDA